MRLELLAQHATGAGDASVHRRRGDLEYLGDLPRTQTVHRPQHERLPVELGQVEHFFEQPLSLLISGQRLGGLVLVSTWRNPTPAGT